MKLEFSEEDLQLFARAIALEVAKELKPVLKSQDKGGDKVLSVESLSSYLGVQKEWVYGHIKELPHYKVGRFPRFRKTEVDRWLERHKVPNSKYL